MTQKVQYEANDINQVLQHVGANIPWIMADPIVNVLKNKGTLIEGEPPVLAEEPKDGA